MARNDDDGQLDAAKELANVVKAAIVSGQDLRRTLSESKRDLADLGKLFQEIVETSDDLPDSISSSSDLQKEMIKDAKLFNKVQERSINLLDKNLKEGWEKKVLKLQKSLKLEGEELKKSKEYKQAFEKHQELEQKSLTVLTNRFKILQKEANQRKLDALSLGNINDMVNDLGAKIRHPDLAFTSILSKAGSLPSRILESSKNSKHLGETLKKLVAPAIEKIAGFGRLLFSPTGLLIAGVALAAASATTLYKLFSNFWEFLDKKVMPAVADFNKQIGGTGKAVDNLRSMSVSAGVQFEMLGMSFQEGAAAVRDFVSGLQSTDAATRQNVDVGKKLIAVYGMTGEEAGRLALQFQKQTGSLDGLTDMVMTATRESEKFGVPVNDVIRDLGKFPNILARFGTANRTEFAKASAKARSYGLDIGKINDAFGEQLDTFEGSSDAAAKLNSIFGTTINSYQLMMETDPTKRMEMLRKSLLSQGKEWKNLSKFEQNVITSTMGVDKETAQLILSSDKERKKLEATAKEREQQVKLNQKWDNSLGKVKRTLLNWEAVLGKVMRSITAFAGKVLFNIDVSKDMTKFAGEVEKAMGRLSMWFDKLTLAAGEEGFTGILADLGSLMKGENNSFTGFTETIQDMKSALSAVKTILEPIAWMIEQLKNLPDALSFFGALITGDTATMNKIATKQGAISMTPIRPTPHYTKPTFDSSGRQTVDFGANSGGKSVNQNVKYEFYLDGKQLKAEVVKASRP